MLEVVGIPANAERLYFVILEGPRQIAEIAASAGMTRQQVEEALPVLEARGLVNRTADSNPRYLATPPGPAVEALVLARQQELEQLRVEVASLHDRYRAAAQKANTAELVQVLSGEDAVRMQWYELQRSAREEIRMFDVPPYLAPGLNELELQLLKSGVRYRVLYDESAMEIPGQLPLLETLTAAGEEARVLRGLPMKLDIADRSVALMPLEMGVTGTDAIVVRGSALLETLISYFDFMWDRAVPVDVWRPDKTDHETSPFTDDDLRLLSLLAAGVKDHTIATQLSIGLRTVERRVRRMMDELGAQTRFQAGIQAVRKGLLREDA